MKYCLICSAAIQDGQSVCPECGAEVHAKQKRYVSTQAKCPFYIRETNQTIHCEGLINNSSIHFCFSNRTDKHNFKHAFCYSCYENCKMYQNKTK